MCFLRSSMSALYAKVFGESNFTRIFLLNPIDLSAHSLSSFISSATFARNPVLLWRIVSPGPILLIEMTGFSQDIAST